MRDLVVDINKTLSMYGLLQRYLQGGSFIDSYND